MELKEPSVHGRFFALSAKKKSVLEKNSVSIYSLWQQTLLAMKTDDFKRKPVFDRTFHTDTSRMDN